MKKQLLTKKEIKKIKKKIKQLKGTLEQFEVKKIEKETALVEELELWDSHLRPYETAFKKAKKKLKNRKKSIAILEKLLKKKKKKASKKPSKSKARKEVIPSASKAISREKTENDLKKIEGIGPKIEEILKTKGILTFEQLAKTSTKQLYQLLHKAGNRFTMHQPDSWPEQAALAANGQWKDLQELQEQLNGGRK